MHSRQDEFAALQKALSIMIGRDREFALAWALQRLVDSGHVVAVDTGPNQGAFMIHGFSSVEEVAHLISTIDDSVHSALLELAVMGLMCFRPIPGNLQFAVCRVSH